MKYILQKKGAARVGRSQVLTIKHYLQSLKRALSTVSFVDYLLLFYFTFFITSATFSFMASSRKSRATMVPSGANKMMWGIPWIP